LLIVIGCFFAVFHLGSGAKEADLFVPILFKNVPEQWAVSSPGVKGLDLRVRGTQSGLYTLMKEPQAYQMDLSGISAGMKQIPIDPASLTLPRGVSIVQLHPESITVKVEEKTTKILPVAVRIAGEPLSGYHVTHLDAEPKEILVSGPEKRLAPLSSAPTQPVDISQRSGSFKKETGFDLPEQIKVVSATSFVTAQITIDEKVMIMTFRNIPVKWRHTAYDVWLTPPAIDIDVKGTERILSRLGAEKRIDAYVDLEGLAPGVYVRRAVIDLPIGTSLAGASPELFTVTVKKR
jgi:YbbR domain-containing protein